MPVARWDINDLVSTVRCIIALHSLMIFTNSCMLVSGGPSISRPCSARSAIAPRTSCQLSHSSAGWGLAVIHLEGNVSKAYSILDHYTCRLHFRMYLGRLPEGLLVEQHLGDCL